MTTARTSTVVVAFGGNAIAPEGQPATFGAQRERAERMADAFRELAADGHRMVLTHGNGPQVGNLSIQQEEAAGRVAPQPLSSLGAMTQGQMGSLLGVALRNVGQPAVSLVTHVLVSADDPAFDAPSKPIGPFFDEEEAHRLAAERSWVVAEDANRGYRRVVASPRPESIVEAEAIRSLLDAGAVVIAAGGGGIPVVRVPDDGYEPVEAVIDKDFAAERLANLLGARTLLLVTAVPQVALDHGTPRERPVARMSADEAERHLADGQFPSGSMGPKVAAAVEFVRRGGEAAIITSPDHMRSALAGDHGTRIVGAQEERQP